MFMQVNTPSLCRGSLWGCILIHNSGKVCLTKQFLGSIIQCKFESLLLVAGYIICEKHTQPAQNQGMDSRDMKHSESKTYNDSLARSGVWWVGTPRTVTANTYSLACRSLPGYSLGESYTVTVFPELPKSHRVFFLLPSYPKFTFLNKDFCLSLLKHPVSLGTLQV